MTGYATPHAHVRVGSRAYLYSIWILRWYSAVFVNARASFDGSESSRLAPRHPTIDTSPTLRRPLEIQPPMRAVLLHIYLLPLSLGHLRFDHQGAKSGRQRSLFATSALGQLIRDAISEAKAQEGHMPESVSSSNICARLPSRSHCNPAQLAVLGGVLGDCLDRVCTILSTSSSKSTQALEGDFESSMSTSALDVNVAPAVATGAVTSTNESRLGIGDEVIEKTKGAATVAILALGIAAQVTQNVPYLGAISTALTELIKIQDEADECKDECKATMADAEEMNDLINAFREKCNESGRGDGLLNGSLCKEFAKLERVVLECILTLQKCKVGSKRKRDRVRLYLKRSELAKSVKECSSKMGKALQQFNTSLQVDQVILLQDMRLTLNKIYEAQTSNAMQAVSPAVPCVSQSLVSDTP
ncbi:hypothetical protein PENSPDRAFT_672177 [Peniophora sp. CONT]|nr:hypothetical protein PENSPDRAFT_672177 [Peniophora sp. CONT]